MMCTRRSTAQRSRRISLHKLPDKTQMRQQCCLFLFNNPVISVLLTVQSDGDKKHTDWSVFSSELRCNREAQRPEPKLWMQPSSCSPHVALLWRVLTIFVRKRGSAKALSIIISKPNRRSFLPCSMAGCKRSTAPLKHPRISLPLKHLCK